MRKYFGTCFDIKLLRITGIIDVAHLDVELAALFLLSGNDIGGDTTVASDANLRLRLRQQKLPARS